MTTCARGRQLIRGPTSGDSAAESRPPARRQSHDHAGEIRPPAKSLALSAEAVLQPGGTPGALVFGPENGAFSERLVYEAAREGHARSYEQLIVIGFAIEAAARELVEKCGDLVGIPADYVQATPDLVMGDLLKTMRSSQIFSVTGLPDVGITQCRPRSQAGLSGIRSSCAGSTFSTRRRWRSSISRATMSQPGSSTPTTTTCAS